MKIVTSYELRVTGYIITLFRFISFAFFICLCQVVFAQDYAKIDVELQQEMALRNPSDKLKINIILTQQYDQMELRGKASAYTTKEAKRNFVVNELKRFSAETQTELFSYLDLLSKNSQVSEVKSYWIANFIGCSADVSAIEVLSSHPDVLLIGMSKDYQCIPETVLPEPVLSEPVLRGRGEIAWHVLKINAPQVWEEGYTGEGIIIAINDSGVDYNHLDLRDQMWEHPDFPNHGWNFRDNNNDPMDDLWHGTHCAGIAAGNGTAGTQTGIAPKAKIMAVKVSDENGSTPEQICEGIQFSVEYGAHIISMSLGYNFPKEEHNILFRITMENVLEAGVIASVAAGNLGIRPEWCPPYEVSVPGSCPPPWLHPDQTTIGGISAVVCVGLVDSTDLWYKFEVSPLSSSRGPSTWQNIAGFNDYPFCPGMGLIRPDICAPGISIESCLFKSETEYIIKDGSSMACPAVSGVMALMLSKNIELTPAEICEILETTAVHLPNPDSPKGNKYGSGRVDAFAAVCSIESTLLQNKTETGTVSYSAVNTIAAGNNVTESLPVGNYEIQSGSDVTFRAGNEIYLTDGFISNEGSSFHAYIDTVNCDQPFKSRSAKSDDPPGGHECPCDSLFSKGNSNYDNNEIIKNENNIQNRTSFNLHPNPNSGTFQLETNFLLSDIFTLKVMDMLGVTVYESKNITYNTISMENSAAGFYFVVIILKDGTVLTEKMMKQR